MVFNGAGFRDTARTLKVGIPHYKKSSVSPLRNTFSTNWMHYPLNLQKNNIT